MKKVAIILVIVILAVGIIVGIYLVRRQQNLKSKATIEGTRIEVIDSSGNVLSATSSASIKLRLTFVPSQPPQPTATPQPPAPTTTPAPPLPTVAPPSQLNPKVLLLIYNPIIESQGNQRLVNLKNWNNPDTLTNTFINSVKISSGGLVNYTTVERQEIDMIPVKGDGFEYSDETYLNCINSGGSSCHNPDLANYVAMINQSGACDKRNLDQIDELWIWGGPYFGYWESNLAGVNAFWYNSPPTLGTNCTKLLPIMGFNYERAEAEMFEDFGHRAESTMLKVFGSWAAGYNVESATALHDWDRFSMLDNQSLGNGGCGNAHTGFNSTLVAGSYDRTSTRTVRTSCRDFANYPNLTGQTEELSCSVWGCTDLGYFKEWFFKYFPRRWWAYLVDPQNTITLGVQGISKALAQEVFPAHFRIANTQADLPQAQEQLFDSNPKVIDWHLLEGNGTKTIYVQFKINNIWSAVYSATVELINQPSLGPSPSSFPSPTATQSATPTSTPKPSKSRDFNKDNKVNSFDISLLLSKWRSKLRADLDIYDLNEDEVINSFDYALLKKDYSP